MNIAIISPGPFSVPPVKGSSVEHDIDEVTIIFDHAATVEIYTR
ncbi:glycosyltransferase family 1 protein, partial [Mesorhizobium sp. M00.F.Ca.ET.186.01.1.1]